eukprot:201816_1
MADKSRDKAYSMELKCPEICSTKQPLQNIGNSNYTVMSALGNSQPYGYGQSLYYPNDHCIFTICERSYSKMWIIKHDLSNDTYSEYIKPAFTCFTINDEYSGQHSVINSETNELFTFCGASQLLVIVNLKNKQITTNIQGSDAELKHNIPSNLYYPSIIYIPSPINEIHIIGRSDSKNMRHLRYNSSQNKLEQIAVFKESVSWIAQLIFIECEHKLFLFNGKTDNIWCCDIHINIEQNQKRKYEWKLMDLKLPKLGELLAMKLFDTIIVLFYLKKENGIWLFDLLNKKNGWVKYDKILAMDLLIDNQNGLALQYDVIKGNRFFHSYSDDGYHYKFSVINVLTKPIYNKYGIMYKNIMNGFIRKVQKECLCRIHIPNVLVHLMILFYSCFEYHPEENK